MLNFKKYGYFGYVYIMWKKETSNFLLPSIHFFLVFYLFPDPIFFLDCTVQLKHSQRTHSHPYEHTYANPTPMSIFEDWAGKSSRLTKSPEAPRCWREHRLLFNAQRR